MSDNRNAQERKMPDERDEQLTGEALDQAIDSDGYRITPTETAWAWSRVVDGVVRGYGYAFQTWESAREACKRDYHARRRLEPKPDGAALKEVQPPTHTIHAHECIYCHQHWSWCAANPICDSAAQPKPDAAGDATDGLCMTVIIGQGGVGLGASRNAETGALSVLFQELQAPQAIGSKADPRIDPSRDVMEIRIETVEAADVLLHAVSTVRDVLSGRVTWEDSHAAYSAMDSLLSAPHSRDQSDLREELEVRTQNYDYQRERREAVEAELADLRESHRKLEEALAEMTARAEKAERERDEQSTIATEYAFMHHAAEVRLDKNEVDSLRQHDIIAGLEALLARLRKTERSNND